MRLLTSFFFALLLCSYAQAQVTSKDSLWIHQGSFAANFSNVSLHNWAAGGQNSLSLGTVVSLSSSRESETTLWNNKLDFAYGLIRQGESAFRTRKTDDQLILASDYGYKINDRWSVLAGTQVRTQMDVGYEYFKEGTSDEEQRRKISAFMAPGYVMVNLTAQYKYKNLLSLAVSPVSNRITFVLDDDLAAAGAFGVTPGEKSRYELGVTLRKTLEFKVMENTTFKSDLNMFSSYKTLDKWVVNWGTLLMMKVNKYITTNFGTQLIYDPDVDVPKDDGTTGKGVQFKHVLNLGLALTY
ncbi:DUF3078 domain-containing protein [Limibacter armeniacum]|uniref:DUF3078 domain-containing protein n=1 Tax=Limibacter armeniacum TaxID=466084 RepID=UPI002FE514D3